MPIDVVGDTILVFGRSSITVTGTSDDDVGVTSVTWSTDRGESGDCVGTDTWSAEVILHEGGNQLTVSSSDAAGNVGTATVMIINGAEIGANPSIVFLQAFDGITMGNGKPETAKLSLNMTKAS